MAQDILESNFSFLCNSTAYHRDIHVCENASSYWPALQGGKVHYKVARSKEFSNKYCLLLGWFFFFGLISIILSEFWLIYDRMFITSTLNLRPFFNQISTQIIKIVDNQCMTLSKKNNTWICTQF